MTEDEMEAATKDILTKSGKIRALDKLGVTRSQIASFLNIRYQHVRNVLVAPSGSQVSNPENPPEPPKTPRNVSNGPRPLSIEEAKIGLAANFNVPPSAITITISC